MKFIVCVFLFLVILEGFHCAPYYYSSSSSSSSSTSYSNVFTNSGNHNALVVGGNMSPSMLQSIIMNTLGGGQGGPGQPAPCC